MKINLLAENETILGLPPEILYTIIGGVVGIILLIVTTFNGLYFDMHDMSPSETKLSFINTLVSFLFPFVLLGIHFGVSLTRIDTFYIYIFEAFTSILVLVVSLIFPKTRWNKVFRAMEVR